MKPLLLTDKSKLQEVYLLRVTAWEDSDKKHLINQHLLPNGWKDKLDNDAAHWVIVNKNNVIIASARLNVLDQISHISQYQDFCSADYSINNRFAYISRLVVRSDFRNLGLARMLDKARIDFAMENGIKIIVGTFDGHRIQQLNKYGFVTEFLFTNKLVPENTSGVFSAFMRLDITNLNYEILNG